LLFGIVWAWLVLGEQPTLLMVIAAAMILGGVALAQKGPVKPGTAKAG
jgi:drug/metabolite transporter (DMT)-like permease